MNPRLTIPVLAGFAALGAWTARPVSALVGGVLIFGAVRLRRPWVWCLLVAAATSTLAARSWAGVREPGPPEVRGLATLITDPDDRHGSVHAEVRIGGRHYDAWARGGAEGSLRRALAGEVLEVQGTSSPLRGRIAPHLRRRHVVARLQVDGAGIPGPGTPLTRLANDLRRRIDAGAAALPERQRGLFGGFVLGDDRGQDDETVERFREAGLSHLLVVSGQNVAFAMLLAAPLVARGPNGARLAWTGVLLIFFGTVVRWEPSVMRAVVMAGLAVSTRTLSRTADRFQLLMAAVIVILFVDPLLVGSVSFLLSVSASAGIAIVSPWLAQRLSGPRPFVELLAATAGAQVGVAPVLLAVFGSLPLASVPANLLAVPVAGPLMMWGMIAGVPAGFAGGRLATVLHWPTGLMLGWIDGVARWASGLELPALGLHGALAVAAATALGALTRRLATGREVATRGVLVRPDA